MGTKKGSKKQTSTTKARERANGIDAAGKRQTQWPLKCTRSNSSSSSRRESGRTGEENVKWILKIHAAKSERNNHNFC